MVADFYTKPLQGKLFRIFRNRILNLEEDPCTEEDRCQILKQQQKIAQEPKQDSSVQECVGHSGNEPKTEKCVPGKVLESGHVSTIVSYDSTAGSFTAIKSIWGQRTLRSSFALSSGASAPRH
eukprot:5868909-Ditylum_brightwellii.AAC.1